MRKQILSSVLFAGRTNQMFSLSPVTPEKVPDTQVSQVSHLYSPFTTGGGPSVVVSTATLHARARGSVPGLGGLRETKMFLPHPRVKGSIVGSLRDREIACSASDRQGSNFESCVWRTVSSHSSHHPQEVLLGQFAQRWPKARFISFHFPFTTFKPPGFYFLCLGAVSPDSCHHHR